MNKPPDARWFALLVRRNSELLVARALEARGFEAFVPMHTVARQWSDREKSYDTPVFSCYLFCRFPLTTENKVLVLSTRDVCSIVESGGVPTIVPDQEIRRLRCVFASRYPLDVSDNPATGETVEIISADEDRVTGVLIERHRDICRVAIGFESVGRVIILKVPASELKPVDGPLRPHWSLKLLGS